MSEFVLHPDAAKDLEEIWEYIAADSLDAADRVREEIYEAIQSLVPFPYVGHQRPDITSRRTRYCPGGTSDNSPAFQRRVRQHKANRVP